MGGRAAAPGCPLHPAIKGRGALERLEVRIADRNHDSKEKSGGYPWGISPAHGMTQGDAMTVDSEDYICVLLQL